MRGEIFSQDAIKGALIKVGSEYHLKSSKSAKLINGVYLEKLDVTGKFPGKKLK